MTRTLRQRIYQIFHEPDPADPITLIDNYLVPVLIAIDVAALILESFDSCRQQYAVLFHGSELTVIAVFTLEYGLRLWSCVENPAFAQPLWGRLRYVQTAFALVDLAAFLPFYALNLMPVSWAAIASPFFRLLRLLKLTRYSESTQIFFRVLRDKRDELLTTLFVVLTLLVVASSLMYFIERQAQPQEFASIPAAMWWGVITLTTVGYGDVHPITPLGKFLSAILAFLGIGVFALPARDIAAAFSDEMQMRRAISKSGSQAGPKSGLEKPPLLQTRKTIGKTMIEMLRPSGLSLAQLREYITLSEAEANASPWLDVSAVQLSESEQTRLAFLQADLQSRRMQLMSEATVWARAIYPLLLLAEAEGIQAHRHVPLSAMFQAFEVEATAGGVLGQGLGEAADAPYRVVVEARQGVEGRSPLVQLYLEILAAARLNGQRDNQSSQELFGCHTAADVWTFLRAEVSGLDAPKPELKIEFSREYSGKLEADEICKILKKIVQDFR